MKLATRINSFLPHFDNDVAKVLADFHRIGLTHVDFNYPEHVAGIPAEQMRQVLADCELSCNGVALRFRGDFYLNGELGNADSQVAQAALDLCKEACDYCRAVGGHVVTIWLGFDGFDYSFQINYNKVWEQQKRAFQQICDYAPDLQISIEYKPFEERSYAFIDSFGTVFSMIQDVNRPNLGATLDFCHMLMKHDYQNAIYFDTFPIREQGIKEAERNVRMITRLDQIIDELGIQALDELVAQNDGLNCSDIILKVIS